MISNTSLSRLAGTTIAAIMAVNVLLKAQNDDSSFNTEDQEDQSENLAYIRCWLMIPVEIPPLRKGNVGSLKKNISISVVRGEVAQVLINDGYPYQMTGYVPIEAGLVKIMTTESANDAEAVKARRPVNLGKGSFYTVIISGMSTTPQLTILDDSQISGIIMLPDGSLKKVAPSVFSMNFMDSVKMKVSDFTVAAWRQGQDKPLPTVVKSPVQVGLLTVGGSGNERKLELTLLEQPSQTILGVPDIFGNPSAAVVPNCYIGQ